MFNYPFSDFTNGFIAWNCNFITCNMKLITLLDFPEPIQVMSWTVAVFSNNSFTCTIASFANRFMPYFEVKNTNKLTCKCCTIWMGELSILVLCWISRNANDQSLCFCYKRKDDMLLIRILVLIKHSFIKQWTLKGYGTNINKVFNTDSNDMANYSKNW